MKTDYDDPEIIITENGVGDDGSSLDDIQRAHFIVVGMSFEFSYVHNYVIISFTLLVLYSGSFVLIIFFVIFKLVVDSLHTDFLFY